MGPVRTATVERIAGLTDPDVALVALALRLADLLDGDETATASAAKEYRATVLALTKAEPSGPTLDDLDEE